LCQKRLRLSRKVDVCKPLALGEFGGGGGPTTIGVRTTKYCPPCHRLVDLNEERAEPEEKQAAEKEEEVEEEEEEVDNQMAFCDLASIT
jgi:hypothetical protein